jgi:hypothetical protein
MMLAMRLWLRLFVVSGISTESVHRRIAVFERSSGLREVMVSSLLRWMQYVSPVGGCVLLLPGASSYEMLLL